MTTVRVSPEALRASAGVLRRAAAELTDCGSHLDTLLHLDVAHLGTGALQPAAETAGSALRACRLLAGADAELAGTLGWLAGVADALDGQIGAALSPVPGAGPDAPAH